MVTGNYYPSMNESLRLARNGRYDSSGGMHTE